jgi:glucokinase
MIGIDIGGSNARVALVDGARIVAARQLETGRQRSPDDICTAIADAAHSLVEENTARVAGAGVGVAGQVDPTNGLVHYAPNLDWHDVPIRDRLSHALDLPVAVLNDVQAAAFGEYRYGAARGADDTVALFVGTGVGGGIIMGGELMRGCNGSAGEIGHIPIELSGAECRCGRHGCLEAYVGGWAIARRVREAVDARPGEAAFLKELAGGSADTLSAEILAQAATTGDPLALEIVGEIAYLLGVGLAAIANAFNPCLIVLGGAVIEGTPKLMEVAEDVARKRALPGAVRSLRVRRAELNSFAGTIGAAAWARHSLERSP